MKEELAKIKIMKTGHLVLMDKNLNFIYYPNKDTKTLKDLNGDLANNLSAEISKNSTSGLLSFDLNGDKRTVVYQVLSNGWVLSTVVPMNEVLEEANKLIMVSLLILVSAIIIGIIYSVIFANSLTKPIKQLSKSFTLVSHGNLNTSLEIKSKDEIGDLSKEFNQFIYKLLTVIKDIQLGSGAKIKLI